MRLSIDRSPWVAFAALFALVMGLTAYTGEARADDAIATWEPVTQRVDGSAVVSPITYDIELSQNGTVVDSATVTGTQHTFTGLNSGNYEVSLTATEDGRTSAPTVRTLGAAPQAPTLTVIINVIQ